VRLGQSTTGQSFGTYIINVQTHAQDISVLSFLLQQRTVTRVGAANIVRRPCSNSSHVSAPDKFIIIILLTIYRKIYENSCNRHTSIDLHAATGELDNRGSELVRIVPTQADWRNNRSMINTAIQHRMF